MDFMGVTFMSDQDKKEHYQKALQQALIEHLIDTGIIDSETFQESVTKWQKKMGLEIQNKPLEFLHAKPKAQQPGGVDSFVGAKPKSVIKILLVDDVKFIRDLIRSTLSSQGYSHFIEGSNGYEAVELFEAERPDIVISDIEMKGLNGLEALKKIRETDKNVPVIIMTGNPTEDYVKHAVEYGMTDFVAKPIDVNRLMSVIEKRLGQ
jgi:CheY-like chemotaxis protein